MQKQEMRPTSSSYGSSLPPSTAVLVSTTVDNVQLSSESRLASQYRAPGSPMTVAQARTGQRLPAPGPPRLSVRVAPTPAQVRVEEEKSQAAASRAAAKNSVETSDGKIITELSQVQRVFLFVVVLFVMFLGFLHL